jgi:hypothetical protein
MFGGMNPPPESPFKVFFSYSHKDRNLVDQLLVHLRSLERARLIDVFDDRTINPGSQLFEELNMRLAQADIVLFLISADSLVSQNVEGEVQAALRLHESRGTLIVPVLLRPCHWSESPLARFNALPEGARPVTSWPSPDEAFLNISTSIRRLVESTRAERAKARASGAAPVRSDLPTGYDRLHAAYLAVLETPNLYPFLENWDVAQFVSTLDRAALERLRAKYPDAAPPPLWTAWMQSVHGARLGTASGDAPPSESPALS